MRSGTLDRWVLEGEWDGTTVIIAFPGLEQARAWYHSPGYQEILALRTDHVDGEAVLVAGVPPDFDIRTQAWRRALAPQP